MIRILDITLKDLLQLSRDFKTFMFLLIMPVLFTLLFGFAFGGFGNGESDSRLPVGFLNLDDHWISDALGDLLHESEVIRLEEDGMQSPEDLERLVADGDFAAAIIIPREYGRYVLKNKSTHLIVIAETGSSTWNTIQAEILTAASRLDSAVRTATILEQIDAQRMPFDFSFEQSLSAWDEPPIAVKETTSLEVEKASNQGMSLAHTSPGMMLQFAIAGLLTAAQIIVAERKSRTFQRLLTTATSRFHILIGHYLAIFFLIFTQFTILILFGQFILKVDYLREPAAIFLVTLSTALCISAMGLFIGVLARSEEQAVSFSLIPMFVFSGLGGAWVPLEITGPVFQAVGHISPVAWGMDGFKNICARGLGLESVLVPALALTGYAVLFFTLAVLKMNSSQEN